MKIAVFGAGGVGGYFGGRLAQGGADVHLIARGAHLDALKSTGLRIESPLGDLALKLPATVEPADIGPVDVVLFCVKSTDTEASARRLAPLLHDDTAVVTLQNGVDNEDKIAAIIGGEHVAGGVAYIMATIGEPGQIVHEGKMARIVFGELERGQRGDSRRLENLLAVCERSGVDAAISDDIRVELWQKMAFICAIAGMTAAVRLPVGDLRACEESLAMLQTLAAEAVAVARANGLALDEGLPEKLLATVHDLPHENYSSLHYDLTHGKPMELEALHGTLRRLAGKAGVPVPATDAVYAILRPWAMRNA